MKEIPILMSTPMVQAILEGRKSQTRRIVKPQPKKQLYPCGTGKKYWTENPNDLKAKYFHHNYGEIGSILWVRETWNTLTAYYEKPDYSVMVVRDFVYKADDNRFDKWKPSIFMPKEACRIRLLVEDVRVERLQDITEEDAKAEGYLYSDWHRINEDAAGIALYSIPDKPICWYAELWRSINGKDSWDKNPWVWVITFTKL